MPGFLSPGKGVPLLLIPEYSGINKGQRVPVRSKTAHRKPLVKCFLTPMNCSTPGSVSITNSWSLHKFMSIESMMPPNNFNLCHPFLLPPSIFPSIRVFSSESALHIRWPKYWSFSFSISPSNEQPGLISFRMNWLDLLAVQGTLKSLLQHHSLKTSVLRCSAFFIVQLSHPYMTPGKIKALTRWTFVGKVSSLLFIYLFFSSLLFNMLSRLVKVVLLYKMNSLLFYFLKRIL